jgi:hypothetical protein
MADPQVFGWFCRRRSQNRAAPIECLTLEARRAVSDRYRKTTLTAPCSLDIHSQRWGNDYLIRTADDVYHVAAFKPLSVSALQFFTDFSADRTDFR